MKWDIALVILKAHKLRVLPIGKLRFPPIDPRRSVLVGAEIYHNDILNRVQNNRSDRSMIRILEGVVISIFGRVELPGEGVLVTLLFSSLEMCRLIDFTQKRIRILHYNPSESYSYRQSVT